MGSGLQQASSVAFSFLFLETSDSCRIWFASAVEHKEGQTAESKHRINIQTWNKDRHGGPVIVGA